MALPLARSIRSIQPTLTDIGLLVLRIAFGGMLLVGHGWSKLQNYSTMAENFADPIGIGMRNSLLGAIFAEVVCSALVIIGLATRLAGLVLVFAFCVAALIVHQNDPMFAQGGSSKEPALTYLCVFLALVFLGPGRVSIDYLLAGKPLRPDKY